MQINRHSPGPHVARLGALRWIALLGFALASVSWNALGQATGTPAARIQVVEAATGAPVAQAVVVIRWETVRFRPSAPYRSAGWDSTFEDAAYLERVSDAKGWIDLPAVAASGADRLDHRTPRIYAFKSGFDPLRLDARGTLPATLRLAARNPSGAEHALRIFEMQGGTYDGLRWREIETSKMPRMAAALHAEKMSLGEDGWAILPLTAMPGRSGAGAVIRRDFEPYKATRPHTPLPLVLEIRWRIVPVAGGASRNFIEQRSVGAWEAKTPFVVSPWRYPDPSPAGWRIDAGAQPTIRVFAPGYRASAERAWKEAGGEPVTMDRHGDDTQSLLAELRAWRRHIDEALARDGPEEGLPGQARLARLLAQECGRITMDLRAGICFEANSDMARAAARLQPTANDPREDDRGTYAARNPRRASRIPEATGSAIMAQSVRVPVPVRAKPVDGFSIGPAKGVP